MLLVEPGVDPEGLVDVALEVAQLDVDPAVVSASGRSRCGSWKGGSLDHQCRESEVRGQRRREAVWELSAHGTRLTRSGMRNRRAEEPPLPTFLGVGAPRTGTTWLHSNLRRHPDIWMTPVKEVHYFDKRHLHRRDNQFYRSHLRKRMRRYRRLDTYRNGDSPGRLGVRPEPKVGRPLLPAPAGQRLVPGSSAPSRGRSPVRSRPPTRP